MDIFAGSLPFKFTDKDLNAIFAAYGEVTSATIVIDKKTRQNKGFGFVEMADRKHAFKAIQELNGSEQMGRVIVVSEAQKNKEGERTHQKPRDWFKKTNKIDDIVKWAKGK
jgi:RNA recognition motif-containing protein